MACASASQPARAKTVTAARSVVAQLARAGVDDVMTAARRPVTQVARKRAGRGDAAGAERHPDELERAVERVLDGDEPAVRSRAARRPPRGRRPGTTRAPAVPWSSSSVTTRSAASPLPIPPGSMPSPAGATTAGVSACRPTSAIVRRRRRAALEDCSGARSRRAPRVAGCVDRLQQRRVVAPAGEAPRVLHGREELEGVGRPRAAPPAVSFSRETSLAGRNRLQRCSSSSSRRRA